MVSKRGANRKSKEKPEDDKPPSEVDVAELVFDSAGETDEGDDEAEKHYNSDESAFDSDEEADVGNEIEHAVNDYVKAIQRHEPSMTGPENHDAALEHDDPASDSSEDERPNRNTIGEVPLEWYKPEEHIGYDQEGKRIIKKGQKDTLDRMLARNDSSKFLRTVHDAYNDEEIVLSKEEMAMINRIRKGEFPHLEVNPFPDENDWFTRETEIMPLTGAPEPKRRFVPSKWEEKKVVKLVRALRRGWIKTSEQRRKEERQKEFKPYMLWGDDGRVGDGVQRGMGYLPPPRPVLPGHAESYNPPPEYLPTEEERAALEMRQQESSNLRPIPTVFDALRLVPAYSNFIRERFERCLDLYLCPRGQRKREAFKKDPNDLVPKLPQPRELKPFPDTTGLRYEGHTGPITCVAPHLSGAWLATSSRDGTVRLWETRTARCVARYDLAKALESEAELEVRGARAVAWCPDPKLCLLGIAVGRGVLLLPVEAAASEKQAMATHAALTAAIQGGSHAAVSEEAETTVNSNDDKDDSDADDVQTADGTTNTGSISMISSHRSPILWRRVSSGTVSSGQEESTVSSAKKSVRDAVLIMHSAPVTSLTWHSRGDYFASTAPLAVKGGSVLVHQLSKGRSQRPFRRQKGGKPVQLLFHPVRPMIFLAVQHQVRIYDLAKQQLLRKLATGSGIVASMAVHHSGDHLILGSEDRRLAWYDLDLSVKPFRVLRFHKEAVRGVDFHRSYPLFASGADDGTVQIFHGRVYADLATQPLIVPVKILRGAGSPVQCVAFHPTQPWVFAGGEDGTATLFINV